MSARPYVLLSVAASLDGCIDDASDTRLLLSNQEDSDRVDEVRSGVDAILVGANTVRADDPRLLVRSPERRQRRIDTGRGATPMRVTMSGSGELNPRARVFTAGAADTLVYTDTTSVPGASERLGAVATVVGAGTPLDLHRLLADLSERGVERLLVEGGGAVHTLFLTSDVVDELHLVYAPFFVGHSEAPRFVHPAEFPQNPDRPLILAECSPIGDVVFLRYHTGVAR